MAKLTNSISVSKCVIDLAENKITEYNGKGEFQGEFKLDEVLARFEDKVVSLTIKEDTEFISSEEV